MPVPRLKFRRRYQAPVAQLDRAPDYESGGQEFESLRARQQLFDIDSEFLRDFWSLDFFVFEEAPGQHALGK